MRSKEENRKLWIQTGVVLLLLAGAAVAFIRAATEPISRDELKITVAELRSLTAAGRQLSEEYLKGQITETFLRTQSLLLQEKVGAVRKKLDSSNPEKGFELKHWQARSLARQAHESLTRLTDNPQMAERTKYELGKLFPQIKELEDWFKSISKN